MNEDVAELGIGAVPRHAVHVLEVLLLGVRAEVHARELGLGEIDERRHILDGVVDEAGRAGGVGGVAAALLDGRGFEHDHARACIACRERCRCCRVTGADNDHVRIELVIRHSVLAPLLGAHRAPVMMAPLGKPSGSLGF